MSRLRKALSRIFEDERSKLFFPVNNLISLFILCSVVIVILQSVPSLDATYGTLFNHLEVFFLFFFLGEYLLRIYSASNRTRYLTSAFGIIDVVSLVPSLIAYLTVGLPGPILFWVARLLRILRLLRTLRLVRFIAPTKNSRSRFAQFVKHVHWLNIEIYLFALMLVVTFSATLMYAAEGTLPETHFPTIPDAMWWAIVTITTVGYGDMVPQTVFGKFIASITMIAGLALFALMLVVVGQAAQRLLFGSSVGERER